MSEPVKETPFHRSVFSMGCNMSSNLEETKECTILIAEDDPDDRLILEAAFDAGELSAALHFVSNGEELMDSLMNEGISGKKLSPNILILDLNMPKKDGRRALWEIRQDPMLHHLPVVVLTTSSAEQDMEYCSQLGILKYVTKPTNLDDFMIFTEYIHQLCEDL